MTPFLARKEVFAAVGSTNDVVRDWLVSGSAEVCLAVADQQTAGRGRSGRTWVALPGTGLLLSLGFRPGWLEPDRTWQLAAVTSLAMADAAEALTGLPVGAIRLKWPNDLVIEGELSGYRKVAGVLGETEGLGTDDPRVVVGLGINVDWPAADFPRELAQSMMSLREASHAQPIDRSRLLDSFVERLESRVDELRAGRFAAVAWSDRQLTTGRTVRLEHPDRNETLRAVGVDALSGALVVEDLDAADGRREVLVGEVNHVRLADPAGAVV